MIGAGGYTNSERVIMMTVLDASMVNDLRLAVLEMDPHAFIILCDAAKVFGEGFTPDFQSSPSKMLVS